MIWLFCVVVGIRSLCFFFFSSRRRHTRLQGDWSSDVCSSDLIKGWGFTPELAMLAGTAGGALLGLIFGWLAIRRQGIYFSMITLALAQMLFFVCLQAPFTGGEEDRKSTRLNSSHLVISYAVFCLKKKK